ncbi:MAG: hypothetical protein GY953_49090, partial [bacterium]|nr:hypothetical protein [bacterium]
QSTPWLRQYQIVQERPDKIVLKTVPLPGRSPSPEEIAALGRRLTAATSGAEVVPTLVDEIPLSPSGKFRLYLPLSSPS